VDKPSKTFVFQTLHPKENRFPPLRFNLEPGSSMKKMQYFRHKSTASSKILLYH
jgi:hypothetical protein